MANDALVDAARTVEAAIRNEGPMPEYHRGVMHRQRTEWPTLWDALDRLLEALDP